ncbi:MAG: PAAR domain-containing protein [Eubacterium sp.]|nr:PAAR domain-containing protein [Eubacterium sp.]
MPQATRKGDCCTGHDGCPPSALAEGSPNVFINGKPAGRLGDNYESHGCLVHAPHQDNISSGSATVFINGIQAGRVDDSVSIGGSVRDGSSNVYIGG